MDRKCSACDYLTTDREQLTHHELIKHDLIRCKFCVGPRFTTSFNIKTFGLTIMGSNAFDSHCSEFHNKTIPADDIRNEYYDIITKLDHEFKRRKGIIQPGEEDKFVAKWKDYVTRCYDYYNENDLAFKEQKIPLEDILTDVKKLIGFVAGVHKFYNQELLSLGSTFPGCGGKSDCTWTYGENRCKCASKKFAFSTDSVEWDLWYISEPQTFSIDNDRPIGTLLAL